MDIEQEIKNFQEVHKEQGRIKDELKTNNPENGYDSWVVRGGILDILKKINNRLDMQNIKIFSLEHKLNIIKKPEQPPEELKPCPSCGSTFNRTDIVCIDFCITCSGCGMNTGRCKSVMEAREIWQRRSNA